MTEKKQLKSFKLRGFCINKKKKKKRGGVNKMYNVNFYLHF